MTKSNVAPIRGGQGDEFLRADWSGKNESGVRPLGRQLLILMDPAPTQTSGGVHLPDEVVFAQAIASESGVIVACGLECFSYEEDGTPWRDYKPVPGDRVFVEKYGGRQIRGRDGLDYRLMTYTNVGGLEDVAGVKKPKGKR